MNTIFKREIQIKYYTLIQYFECTYHLILLHACYYKRVFKFNTTFSSYSLASYRCEVLRLKKCEDEQ